jgi:hypothetical protein
MKIAEGGDKITDALFREYFGFFIGPVHGIKKLNNLQVIS